MGLPGPAGQLLFQEVFSDAAEVGGGGGVAPVLPGLAEGLIEGLLGQLLGEVLVAGQGEQVAVDDVCALPVNLVEVFHSLPSLLTVCDKTALIRYKEGRKIFVPLRAGGRRHKAPASSF